MRHGKREMRKNYTPFAAGMVTTVLLIGLISASLAANTDSGPQPSGGVEPAQIGVGMFLKQQIAPGETLTTEKGGTAPKVLAYADSKGETHYYIEATAVAELFDVTYGVNFHEEANQLEFGAKGRELRDKEGNPTGEMSWSPVTSSAQRHDFNLIASGKTDENGKMDPSTVVIASEGFPATHDDGISFERHSEGREPNPDPELQKEQWARRKSLLKDKPEYGKSPWTGRNSRTRTTLSTPSPSQPCWANTPPSPLKIPARRRLKSASTGSKPWDMAWMCSPASTSRRARKLPGPSASTRTSPWRISSRSKPSPWAPAGSASS